jgi:hypothetical protein
LRLWRMQLELSVKLGVPLLGAHPSIAHRISLKSGARRLLADAQVNTAPGVLVSPLPSHLDIDMTGSPSLSNPNKECLGVPTRACVCVHVGCVGHTCMCSPSRSNLLTEAYIFLSRAYLGGVSRGVSPIWSRTYLKRVRQRDSTPNDVVSAVIPGVS